MRMKCGIGKCGRCNVGSKYICSDGPVFSQKELSGLTVEGHV
jgi:NAD(P)H-flavin reductase